MHGIIKLEVCYGSRGLLRVSRVRRVMRVRYLESSRAELQIHGKNVPT